MGNFEKLLEKTGISLEELKKRKTEIDALLSSQGDSYKNKLAVCEKEVNAIKAEIKRRMQQVIPRP